MEVTGEHEKPVPIRASRAKPPRQRPYDIPEEKLSPATGTERAKEWVNGERSGECAEVCKNCFFGAENLALRRPDRTCRQWGIRATFRTDDQFARVIVRATV